MTMAAWEEWTFTSSLTRPDGVKFEVVCKVSPEKYGDDFPELSEITQMAIGRIAADLRRNETLKSQPVKVDLTQVRPRGPIKPLIYMDEVTGVPCVRDDSRGLLCTSSDPDHRHRAWGGE